MRIAMFTNTYAPLVGGIERSVATFARQLRAAGHKTLVVTPAMNGSVPEPGVFRLPAIKCIGGTAFSLRLPFCPRLTDRLARFRPDVIHCHQPFMLGDTALRYARRLGAALVFTHHTLYERYADQWAPNQESAYRLAVHLPTEFANLCDLVIAPTASVAAIVRSRGVSAPVAIAPTGIDVDHFAGGDGRRARRRWGLGAGDFVIGHVGRLIPAKNLAFLAEAVARAIAHSPPHQRLLLVGEGESLRVIRQVFERMGVRRRLVRTGPLAGQDLADAYAAMDVFAFTSRTDTQGLVVAEAMAAGVPVIALDAPGPRDVVVDRVHGRLLPVDCSADEFATAITEAREDAAARRRWSAQAAVHAQRYSQAACAERLVSAYRQVCIERAVPEPRTRWRRALDRVATERSLIGEKTRIAAATVLSPPAS